MTLTELRSHLDRVNSDEWIEGFTCNAIKVDGQVRFAHCVNGLMGRMVSRASKGIECLVMQELDRLRSLIRINLDETLFEINDGYACEFPQPTPKLRVLAAIDRLIELEGGDHELL